jgi:hypothetical protein
VTSPEIDCNRSIRQCEKIQEVAATMNKDGMHSRSLGQRFATLLAEAFRSASHALPPMPARAAIPNRTTTKLAIVTRNFLQEDFITGEGPVLTPVVAKHILPPPQSRPVVS